jgi:hypothetical protein
LRAPATNFLEALLALSWWGLRVVTSASRHFVLILSRNAAAFGDASFDPPYCFAEVVLLDDVVAVEDGPGAMARHPHHHRLRHSTPSCVGDEAAPQVDLEEFERNQVAADHEGEELDDETPLGHGIEEGGLCGA